MELLLETIIHLTKVTKGFKCKYRKLHSCENKETNLPLVTEKTIFLTNQRPDKDNMKHRELVLFCFATGSCYEAWAGLGFIILLSQRPGIGNMENYFDKTQNHFCSLGRPYVS
jgi:hypothetical protein